MLGEHTCSWSPEGTEHIGFYFFSQTFSILMSWDLHDTVYIKGNCDINGEIASFDLDSTLIVPKSGKKFPKTETDWKWKYPAWPSILKTLSNKGMKLVVFTNQSGKVDFRLKMMERIEQEVGVNILFLVASKRDKYRKPSPLMYYLLKGVQGGFFVGDAAGRKSDFSCSDRKFAANTELSFFTPEDLFENVDSNVSSGHWEWGFIPIVPKDVPLDYSIFLNNKGNKGKGFMIIMTGEPGCGKSTLSKNIMTVLSSHNILSTIVNRDTLKTTNKCLQMAKKCLNNNQPNMCVIVDNTNPNIESRKPYIEMGKQSNMCIISISIALSEEWTQQLRMHREIEGGPHIPEIAINLYQKKYQKPEMNEGFDYIFNIVPKLGDEVAQYFLV